MDSLIGWLVGLDWIGLGWIGLDWVGLGGWADGPANAHSCCVNKQVVCP